MVLTTMKGLFIRFFKESINSELGIFKRSHHSRPSMAPVFFLAFFMEAICEEEEALLFVFNENQSSLLYLSVKVERLF